jgi:hypothetical protein
MTAPTAVPPGRAAVGCGGHATRQRPGKGGEHGAVSPVRSRAGDSPTQHRDLMSQDQDLGLFGGVAARQEHQPAKRPDHEQVDETDQHDRRG